MTKVLRQHAEVAFSRELSALRAVDKHSRPRNCCRRSECPCFTTGLAGILPAL